jgi:hypothetical protein
VAREANAQLSKLKEEGDALVAAANESEIGTDDRQPSSKPVQ